MSVRDCFKGRVGSDSPFALSSIMALFLNHLSVSLVFCVSFLSKISPIKTIQVHFRCYGQIFSVLCTFSKQFIPPVTFELSYIFRWIPTCAKAFIDQKEKWAYLIPQNDTDPTDLAQLFFACVASVMSNQLRSMVINSLSDFLDFFKIHEV